MQIFILETAQDGDDALGVIAGAPSAHFSLAGAKAEALAIAAELAAEFGHGEVVGLDWQPDDGAERCRYEATGISMYIHPVEVRDAVVSIQALAS